MKSYQIKNFRKHSTQIVSLFLALIFIGSCIYPFEVDLEVEDYRIMIVEGQITDEEGPFRVRLTYSCDLDELQIYNESVVGANVQIFDDKGNSWQLFHTYNGWYETTEDSLKGIAGNTYTLNIITSEGMQYESSPVYMNEVPEIDSLYFDEITGMYNINNQPVEENRMDIYLNTHDPVNNTKYWKWEYEETWEIWTPKDFITVEIKDEDGQPFYFKADVEFRDGNIVEGWDNTKERCWVSQLSKSLIINSTAEKFEDKIEMMKILSIPPEDERLHIKYSILVKQMAINKELYEYFHNLERISEQSGSLFDMVPDQVFGNIYCCNGDGVVLGYFSASEIKTKRINIGIQDHNMITSNHYSDCVFGIGGQYLGHAIAIYDTSFQYLAGSRIGGWKSCVDCRYYGSNIKPEYW